jgi:hypothetical protein
MAKAKGPPPFPELVALEERAAAIISSAVDAVKTEQQILKALKAAGIDVRRLPSQFVSAKIEDGLKAARLAASALRTPRKKKPSK